MATKTLDSGNVFDAQTNDISDKKSVNNFFLLLV